MHSILKIFLLILFISFSHSVFSQTNKEKAYAKYKEGIKLVDNGKFDEGINKYNEALKFDPDNIVYKYESAYAYYALGKYQKVVDVLEKIVDDEKVYDQVYQLLGNAYDMLGNKKESIETYIEGLKKFPKSGCLHMEIGNLLYAHNIFTEAVLAYEKGVEVEPTYSSNYYHAAMLFSESDQEIWSMIYGELFINLEPNSKRAAEMSKALFFIYRHRIEIKGDTLGIYFFQTGDTTKNKRNEFAITYLALIVLAIQGEKNIYLNPLDRIRTKFIDTYYEEGLNSKFPNVLFDYQKKIRDAGHFEAYNHFLLQKGDEEDFEDWKRKNKDKWEAFQIWYVQNPIKIDENNKFYSEQYLKFNLKF